MKRKKSFFSLAFFLAGFTGWLAPALAADLAVCPTCAYTSIQNAIDAAVAGDRVVVGTPGRQAPETYNGTLSMKSGVDVVSEPAGGTQTTVYTDPYDADSPHTAMVLQRATLTILEKNGAGSTVNFDDTISEPTMLDGFTIQDSASGDSSRAVSINSGGTNPLVSNCIIRSIFATTESKGIAIIGAAVEAAPTIQQNFIHHLGGPGIANGTLSHATITSNQIWDCQGAEAPGIGLHGFAHPVIDNNLIFNNQAGIGAHDTLGGGVLTALGGVLEIGPISNNTIYGNVKGGIRMKRKKSDGGEIHVTIGGASGGNFIYNNGQGGIRLDNNTGKFTFDVIVDGNAIYGNTLSGIRLYRVGYCDIINNTINDNGEGGIFMSGKVKELVIANNDIYDNSRAAARLMLTIVTNFATIHDNRMHGNGYNAIDIDAAQLATITGNEIYQNGFGGIAVKGNCEVEITNNNIYENIRGGIHTGNEEADGGGFADTPGTAILTIAQNKIHGVGQSGYGGGIDVRHASGVISNNLVYNNHLGGIRYGDYIQEITNNTVVGNGDSTLDKGGGIIYDDLAGAVNDPASGSPTSDIYVVNNISVANVGTGIRDGLCGDLRDYNLLYNNKGKTVVAAQIAGCAANANEIFADPLFVDMANDDYHLQAGSPAIAAGDDGYDLGAYGGSQPIAW